MGHHSKTEPLCTANNAPDPHLNEEAITELAVKYTFSLCGTGYFHFWKHKSYFHKYLLIDSSKTTVKLS